MDRQVAGKIFSNTRRRQLWVGWSWWSRSKELALNRKLWIYIISGAIIDYGSRKKQKNRTTPWDIPKFSKTPLFHLVLILKFPEFSLEWFPFRKFDNFRIFWNRSREISCTICPRFENFGIFGWMDSDPWVKCLWGGFNFLLSPSFLMAILYESYIETLFILSLLTFWRVFQWNLPLRLY